MYAVTTTLTLYAASLEEAKRIQVQIFDSIEQGVTTPCEQGVFAIQITESPNRALGETSRDA